MRILLRLKAKKDVLQDKSVNSKYYRAMHGWIYNRLEGTEYAKMHEKNEFKPFCFGNVYTVKKGIVKADEEYSVWISSPDEMLMINLVSNIDREKDLNLGEYSFSIVDISPKPVLKVDDFFIIRSETIVNVCVPVGKKFRAITLEKDREKFLVQLKKNLIRKYNQFFDDEIGFEHDLWRNVEIEQISRSEHAVKMNFVKGGKDNWFTLIGARYVFRMGELDEVQKKVFRLCADLGFGERNTFGFGFVSGEEWKDEKNKVGVGEKVLKEKKEKNEGGVSECVEEGVIKKREERR